MPGSRYPPRLFRTPVKLAIYSAAVKNRCNLFLSIRYLYMRPSACASTSLCQPPPSLIVEHCEEQTTGAAPSYKFRHGHVSFTNFILDYPRGAYTGMRTINRRSIVELNSHMKRITDSLSYMHFRKDSATQEPEKATKCLGPYRDPVLLEKMLLPLLQTGLSTYYDKVDLTTHSEAPAEAKVSLVAAYCLKTDRVFLAAHFAPLQEPHENRVKVIVENKSRSDPVVKDSQWVKERAELEENKPKDVNEIILTDDHGNIYEGMASNFFAVLRQSDGSPLLVCASLDHILLGTIMKIVIAICSEHGIKIEWTFPTLSDAKAGKWRGCFLTSTSRALMPIETIQYKNESIEFPEKDETVEFLRREVHNELANRAYKII